RMRRSPGRCRRGGYGRRGGGVRSARDVESGAVIETSGGPRLSPLRRLFPADVPNAAILHALLTGAGAGPAVAGDAERPSWCVLKAAHYGFTFAGGVAGCDLAAAIDRLRRHGSLSLVVDDDASWLSVGAPRPDGEIPRWEFSGEAANADD